MMSPQLKPQNWKTQHKSERTPKNCPQICTYTVACPFPNSNKQNKISSKPFCIYSTWMCLSVLHVHEHSYLDILILHSLQTLLRWDGLADKNVCGSSLTWVWYLEAKKKAENQLWIVASDFYKCTMAPDIHMHEYPRACIHAHKHAHKRHIIIIYFKNSKTGGIVQWIRA